MKFNQFISEIEALYLLTTVVLRLIHQLKTIYFTDCKSIKLIMNIFKLFKMNTNHSKYSTRFIHYSDIYISDSFKYLEDNIFVALNHHSLSKIIHFIKPLNINRTFSEFHAPHHPSH